MNIFQTGLSLKNWGPHISLKIYVKNLETAIFTINIIITFCQGANRATKMDPRKNDFGWRTPATPRLKHILSNIANSKPHPGRASGTIFNACLDFEGAVLKVAGGPFKCEHCHC